MNISRAVLRTVTLLGFTVVFALLASVMAHRYIKQREVLLDKERQRLAAKMADYPEPVQAIVASQDVPAGTKLDASHLAAAPIPQMYLQPYSVQSPNEVLGLVTIAPMAKGEQILTNKLRRADEEPRAATLSSATPQGRRAVTIIVDSITGVGGFIQPRDKVDILWTVTLPSGGQGGAGGQIVTLTLFQEVPVLAIGEETAGTSSAPRARRGEAQSSQPQGGQFMVTLALPPQDTSLLLFARESGRIQLSLRPRNETGAIAIPPANINTLMERVMGKPSQPEQPAGKPTRQVEVYKGLKRDIVDVPEGQP